LLLLAVTLFIFTRIDVVWEAGLWAACGACGGLDVAFGGLDVACGGLDGACGGRVVACGGLDVASLGQWI